MGELDVGAADHPDRLDNGMGLPLQLFLDGRFDGEHRCDAEGVAGMGPHGIDVLNETDGDYLVLGIADYFQLQFFPAQDRLFHQDLPDPAGGNPPAGNSPQFLGVIDEAAAGPAKGISGADYHRVAQFRGDFFRFFHAVGGFAPGGLDPEPVHGFLKSDPVFSPLDGIGLHTEDLHPVLGEDPRLVQIGAEIKGGLAAQIRQEGIRPFFFYDLRDGFYVQRFNIGDVGHFRVGHDGCRV